MMSFRHFIPLLVRVLLPEILLGTSGWSYKEWVGPFYTDEGTSMLRSYTEVFGTAEIDSTFYSYPSKGTVMGWRMYSPANFVFTAKLPKLITHEKELDMSKGIDKDLLRFVDLITPLAISGKLGCILIQLPPGLRYNPGRLEEFFKVLPRNIRFAVEFRHPSWMRPETWRLLEDHKVAYTVVDEPLLPPEVHLTSDIAYFRWHGRGKRPWYNYRYGKEELEPWIPRIREASSNVGRVYGYFNNHYHGYAVENCLQVLGMLGVLNEAQVEAKSRIEDYFKGPPPQPQEEFEQGSLEEFVRPGMDFDGLLRSLIDDERLRRAGRIANEELKIERDTPGLVVARVKDYHIVIDIDNRTIMHDCADWGRMASRKMLCKHVAKLFLSMSRERATDLLGSILKEREEWNFKPYTG
jgi:uncharacterized protein YecE (DUF72 family)